MQDAIMLRVGWLRDLMQLSEPPVPSFGRLAETCLEHTDWPAEVDIQPRSLATLFSKLDREIDLDWLRDRVDVQRVICRVMGRPLGDLRVALGEGPSLLHGRRLRLADARFARELDLGREALPPGIPERAYSPGSWQRAYWVAPAGAGKSLVGAWLTARGLAQYAHVRGASDWAELPRSGALFIEVGRGVTLPESQLEALRERPSPVCIASSSLAPPRGFEPFHSPPIDSYLRALVDWLALRLDESGRFDAARAETWVRQVALPHRAVVGFGEVLGLLGATDEITPRGLRGKSLDDVASAFVERRLADALLDTSWGPAASTQAFAALGQAAAKCLVEPGLDLSSPRTLESWAELLAAPRETPDEEWLVRAMRLADDEKARSMQVERAARRLPPSGYRLARSLSLGGLLITESAAELRADAELSLHPRWLVSLLSARANGTALEMSPSDWGAALLDPSKRSELEAALLARFGRGHFGAIEALIDQFDPLEPSHLAALDACVRQLADVELMGESIPDELEAEVLALACDTLVRVSGRLVPTLGLAGAGAHRAALAALALNHPLPERELDPHRSQNAALRRLFAADCAALAPSRETKLALEWLTLARALCPEREVDVNPPLPSILEVAELLLHFGEGGDGRASHDEHARRWARASGRELELSLRLAARDAGDAILDRAWRLLSTEQLATLTDRDLLHKLWLRVPSELLPRLFASGAVVEFPSLLPHHFVGWLRTGARLPLAAAAHCPLEAVHEAVGERGPICLETDALAAFLPRSPRLAKILVERLSQEAHAEDLALLETLPGSALSELVDALPSTEALLLWHRPALDRVRSLLVTRIEKLGPRASEAILRLRGLEMALGPFRR